MDIIFSILIIENLFLFVFIYIAIYSKSEIQKIMVDQSRKIISNETDIRAILIENLSHEISTPLAVLHNKIEKISDKDYSELDKKLINESFNQIFNIINKIQKYKSIKTLDSNIYDILEFAFESVSISHSYIKYTIDLNLKNYRSCINNLDLAGVFINHIKNSIEANASLVNVFLKDDTIIISDDGVGINNDIVTEICTANLSTKNKMRGNGMFINKTILREYNSSLNIESTDSGTDIILKIPIININEAQA